MKGCIMMDENKALTDKQEQFCLEYLTDLNATQAAIRAGYSENTANEQGSRMLAKVNVQKRIAELQAERAERLQIQQDDILRELASIAFASPAHYMDVVQADGTSRILVKPTAEWTEQQKAAVISIKNTPNGVEIRLSDKVKALELLGKHLGMFNRKELDVAVTQSAMDKDAIFKEGYAKGQQEFFSMLSTDELKRLAGEDV